MSIQTEAIKILYIEDSEADFFLFKKQLDSIEFRKYELDHVSNFDALMTTISKKNYDIYFIDYSLEGMYTGIDYVEEMKRQNIQGPFVLLTGYDQRDLHKKSTKTGIYDYLLKNEITPSLLERVIIHSITRHKDALERLKREKLEHQNQKIHSLGMLAGGVAHELNNMMQPIMLAGDMVRTEAGNNDKLKKAADIIQRNASHSTDIISNILSFSRFEEEETKLLSVQDTVVETLDFVTDLLPKTVTINRHNFDKETYHKSMITVQGMKHILTNIIINAAHAMHNDGCVDITLETKNLTPEEAAAFDINLRNKYCTIQISDTGIGIPERIIEHIFDPFFTTKETGEGTGLGLSIAYSTVKNWRGHLSVDSQEGKGTTFTLYLPIVE